MSLCVNEVADLSEELASKLRDYVYKNRYELGSVESNLESAIKIMKKGGDVDIEECLALIEESLSILKNI